MADRHALDITEVYAALLYYHDHSQEFEGLRRERAELMAEIEGEIRRRDDVTPPNA